MGRFVFRLESVLEHRRRLERTQQREVAALDASRRALEARIRDCRHRLLVERQTLREDLAGSGRMLDVSRLRLQASVSGQIVGEAQRLVIELSGIHTKLESARAKLLEATTARKAVERLKERELEAWRLREKRREERELDELNVMRAGGSGSP